MKRRHVIATALAGGAALTVGRSASHAFAETPVDGDATAAQREAYGTYGGWTLQEVHENSMGRYDPYLTRKAAGDGPTTFELHIEYNRAEADFLRNRLNITDEKVINRSSWRSSAWSGEHNTPAEGVWEVDMKTPARKGVGFALMLWTEDDSTWPVGEINIAEGVTGTGQIMTNLHWGTTQDPQQDPAEHDLEPSSWHRYRVEVAPGVITFSVRPEGETAFKTLRTLNSKEVPSTLPVHLVLQCGADTATLGETGYPDDFNFQEKFLMRPIRMPA